MVTTPPHEPAGTGVSTGIAPMRGSGQPQRTLFLCTVELQEGFHGCPIFFSRPPGGVPLRPGAHPR